MSEQKLDEQELSAESKAGSKAEEAQEKKKQLAANRLAAIRKVLSENMEAQDVEEVIEQAETYIKDMKCRTMVVKCSGFVLGDELVRRNFIAQIACLKEVGINPIVVHGGGDQITQKLSEQGVVSEFHNGLRVTDSATMEIVKDSLLDIGKTLCDDINLYMGAERAVLVTGAIQAVSLDEKLGLVGKVVGIATEKLDEEISNGNILVLPCLGVGENGEFFNVNADTAASKVAVGVDVERLHFLTNVNGIYSDFGSSLSGAKDAKQVISEMTVVEANQMIEDGLINGGMLPKIGACIEALDSDLSSALSAAHILNGTTLNNLLLELFTDAGIGTMIKND